MSNQNSTKDLLYILLNFVRVRLEADFAVFYRYYSSLNQLVNTPMIAGNVYHPSTFSTVEGIPS